MQQAPKTLAKEKGPCKKNPCIETHLLLLLQLVDHIRPEALPRLSDVGANKIADLAKVTGFIHLESF